MADCSLDLALRVRPAGQQDDGTDPQRSQQSRHRVMNPCRAGPGHHDRGVPIHHHRLSDTTEAPQCPQEPLAEVSCRLRTDRTPQNYLEFLEKQAK